MHVLIVCVGSAGDVHPFIAIGLELQRRRHAVQLLASDYFRARVVAAGLDFVPIGSSELFEQVLRDPLIWDARAGFRAICVHLGEMLEPACEQLRALLRPGETVLVGSSLAYPVRLLQDQLGIPAATVHLAPANLISASDPAAWPALPWLHRLPSWAVRPLQSLAERFAIDPVVAPALNAWRRRWGLPPVRRVIGQWAHSPQRVICAFPSWFAEPQADWPPNAVCTGFPRWAGHGGEGLGAALESFLAEGEPPLVFTPGSAMAHGRAFFERALEAAAALGRRAVLVTPFEQSLPPRLPGSACHVVYARYDLLAPRAAAFVHHGGIGTCAQGLAAGVPQLVTPFAHDQLDNAVRLQRLGVAARVSPRDGAKRWQQALSGLLKRPEVGERCRAAAKRMAVEPAAAAQAAEWIESLRSAEDGRRQR